MCVCVCMPFREIPWLLVIELIDGGNLASTTSALRFHGLWIHWFSPHTCRQMLIDLHLKVQICLSLSTSMRDKSANQRF